MKQHIFKIVLCCLIVIGGSLAYRSGGSSFRLMWITPAQHSQHLIEKEDYEAAAQAAIDPLRKGTALYLDGQFKEAAAVFGTMSTAEALFNRGNSFIMLGKYDNGIDSYEKALAKAPDWPEAEANLELARQRKEKMAPPDDDYGGTGGKLGADEIVIGDRKPGKSAETVQSETDQPELSENEQRALWLRKVQTKPADFLRLKFSYQLSSKEQ